MSPTIDYASPGPLTDLASVDAGVLEGTGTSPVDICWPAHTLVIQPSDAEQIGVPPDRLVEKHLRPAASIIHALLQIDPAPLAIEREPGSRVIGTCRHFALLSCALLRHQGVLSRVRCGFATYFQPDQGLDHWITEYWHDGEDRWIRIDSEILGQTLLDEPEDLKPGQFLSGGEAWAAFRENAIDAARFGVYGTENWGPAEIRGNAVKDLAALNKVEMLPWDEWGSMAAAYRGETGPEFDELLDEIAAAGAADDQSAIVDLYLSEELRVPAELMS